jgi:hypothetical protein
MTNDMRCLTNAEIDTVAGGFLLLAALSACIEYTLHATDEGSGGQETDTADTGADTSDDTGGDTGNK